MRGMEGSTRKRSSRISSGLSLLLDNIQRSFVQDRQLRASKDEDGNKGDKEKEEREVEEVITRNMERYTKDVSLHDPP